MSYQKPHSPSPTNVLYIYKLVCLVTNGITYLGHSVWWSKNMNHSGIRCSRRTSPWLLSSRLLHYWHLALATTSKTLSKCDLNYSTRLSIIIISSPSHRKQLTTALIYPQFNVRGPFSSSNRPIAPFFNKPTSVVELWTI